MIKADEVGFFEVKESNTKKNSYVISDSCLSEFGLAGEGDTEADDTVYVNFTKGDANFCAAPWDAHQFRSIRNAIKAICKIEESWEA